MHKEWCGSPCAECKHPCKLDESIPCSPDCEHLEKTGETDALECQMCDALQEFRITISYDGVIHIRATSAEAAREKVCKMTLDELYSRANGTWDIDEAEETFEPNSSHIAVESNLSTVQKTDSLRDAARVEDFIEQIEQWDEVGELSEEMYEKMIADPSLPSRIKQALEKNKNYWESYWEAISEVAHSIVHEHLEKQAAGGGD